MWKFNIDYRLMICGGNCIKSNNCFFANEKMFKVLNHFSNLKPLLIKLLLLTVIKLEFKPYLTLKCLKTLENETDSKYFEKFFKQ